MSDVAQALTRGGDEAELVTELQAGSDAAFDWLVTHYHVPVFNLVYRMIGDAADAADATQEVFLKAFKGIRGFRRGSSLKTWLYRIAIREALNQRRWFVRHARQQTSIDAPDVHSGEAHFELESTAATPLELCAAHELQETVQGALDQVPEVFRSAVVLRDLEGLSYEEVAEVLEVSVGTVKSRIVRGRRALREILEPLLAAHPVPQHGGDHGGRVVPIAQPLTAHGKLRFQESGGLHRSPKTEQVLPASRSGPPAAGGTR
ncbi:MAG TPA: sigma-70 family RNA polymerase sigma factor [Candidatus Acidoferrales bacterium]|nr:sigma-70 family RNA polymerase sigma factor [Candidatus Acidoferrales bacterium]